MMSENDKIPFKNEFEKLKKILLKRAQEIEMLREQADVIKDLSPTASATMKKEAWMLEGLTLQMDYMAKLGTMVTTISSQLKTLEDQILPILENLSDETKNQKTS